LSGIENSLKGSVSAAISSAVVQLMHEYTGRGPTRARTYINEDLITIVLQDTLTVGERSLVRDGRTELVLTTRRAFQQTMSNQLIEAIERLSARKVLAFLSENHVNPDVAVESFVLVPRDSAAADGDRGAPTES
jgi:uncharacterized protein YbcI